MSSLKDIYWMASPLAIDQLHVFRKIEHWTLEVDGKCYELSPDTKKKLTVIKKTTDMIKPHWIDARQWRKTKETQQIEPEKRKIGQTRKTHDQILAEVDYLWTNFNDDWYGFFTQNCQNFVHMLHERVAIEIPKDTKESWERIPDPNGYLLAEGAQLALASKVAAGTMGVTAGGTASGGTMAAGGSTASGTAAAGGTTANGSVAGGTGAAAAGGTTAGGTAAAGSTGTVAAGGTTAGGTLVGGTGTAAAGGTTAGSTTAGGGAVASSHVGLGAKTVGLGTKAAGLLHSGHAAGHIGLGAKAAALAHGGGHAVLIGGGAAKVGAATSVGGPVAGVALAGGLAYLAYRGKKGKRWSKKHKKIEDMDVLDLLMGEEAAFEQVEHPDQDVKEALVAELDDPDQKIDRELAKELLEKELAEEPVDEESSEEELVDEKLAEKLKLRLVTTEPATIQEEHKAALAIQDTRRAQTTS